MVRWVATTWALAALLIVTAGVRSAPADGAPAVQCIICVCVDGDTSVSVCSSDPSFQCPSCPGDGKTKTIFSSSECAERSDCKGLMNGDACHTNGQCASAFCQDGVCMKQSPAPAVSDRNALIVGAALLLAGLWSVRRVARRR